MRNQDGFTLLEAMLAATLLVVVAGALMDPLIVSQKTQTRDANYAWAQQAARTGLDSMVSQVRQATAILSTDPNFVEMNVWLNGVNTHVEYECDVPQPASSIYHECVRVQAAAGAALPPLSSGAVVIRNLLNGTANNSVFSFGPDPVAPYYMTATIQVPASNGTAGGLTHAIVFSSGALMRNMNVGN